MQHYLIIRQSPKPPVRRFPRAPAAEPLSFMGRRPIAVPHPPFPSLRDCVIRSSLSSGSIRVWITSFATNTPSRRKPPRPTARRTRTGRRIPPSPTGSPHSGPGPPRPEPEPFPPLVLVCVSVCSQPPGGSNPPILRADCLTRRGQVPLPKTLSPPTHSLFSPRPVPSAIAGSRPEHEAQVRRRHQFLRPHPPRLVLAGPAFKEQELLPPRVVADDHRGMHRRLLPRP